MIAGAYDVVIAAGVESMSRVPMGTSAHIGGQPFGPTMMQRYIEQNLYGVGGLVQQGISAEIIAEKWKLSREALDEFSVGSHQKAAAATRNGWFKNEIVPVEVKRADGSRDVITTDEGIRPDSSLAKLMSLKPAFKDDGVITAGNSSQITDGAAAVLVMEKQKALDLGLRPRARFHTFALGGVDPVIMLTAPIPATKNVLERAGLTLRDIDAVEINEAFAPVVLAWQREFDADLEQGEPQRRRHRARASARLQRRAAHDDAAEHPRAHGRPLRPPDDVRGRRHGERDDHRAAGLTIATAYGAVAGARSAAGTASCTSTAWALLSSGRCCGAQDGCQAPAPAGEALGQNLHLETGRAGFQRAAHRDQPAREGCGVRFANTAPRPPAAREGMAVFATACVEPQHLGDLPEPPHVPLVVDHDVGDDDAASRRQQVAPQRETPAALAGGQVLQHAVDDDQLETLAGRHHGGDGGIGQCGDSGRGAPPHRGRAVPQAHCADPRRQSGRDHAGAAPEVEDAAVVIDGHHAKQAFDVDVGLGPKGREPARQAVEVRVPGRSRERAGGAVRAGLKRTCERPRVSLDLDVHVDVAAERSYGRRPT